VSHLLLGLATEAQGGTLTAEVVAPARGSFALRVTDLGGGGSVSVESLFDIFSDEGDASPTKYGGTGIGLALSLKFAQLLGGTISVEHKRTDRRVLLLTMPLVTPAVPDRLAA
jgi:signal transduction histidine kinase